MKVNPKLAVSLLLTVPAAVGTIVYGIYYFYSTGKDQEENQVTQGGNTEEKVEESSSVSGGGEDDGIGGSSSRRTHKAPGPKKVSNGQEPPKANNNIENPNREESLGILESDGEGRKEKTRIIGQHPEEPNQEIQEISLESPPGEEKLAEEELESEINPSGFRVVKIFGDIVPYPVQFKALLRQYLVKPTPELREKMEKVEEEAFIRPYVPSSLSRDASIDEIIAHVGKSPWKRLITFENDVMPDEALLEMMEKITPVEVQDLPLPDGLKSKLSCDDYKKNYIGAIRRIRELEKEPEKTPIASAFAMCGGLPKEANQKLNALLDKNWNKRAQTAADMLKRSEDEFRKNFYSPDMANDLELKHFIGMIMRRTKDPKTFITKAEFDDIFAAFKTLDAAGINYKRYNVSSQKAFVLSVLEKMYKDDWTRDLEDLWSANKDNRPTLLKKHKAFARRLHAVFQNFNLLLPEAKRDLMHYLATIVKVEMGKFLDFSFVRAWESVHQNNVNEKVKKDAIQKAYDEYVECAGYYGLTPIKTDDPMKLLKKRLCL